MNLLTLLKNYKQEIVEEAYQNFEPVKLHGYTKVGEERTKEKMCNLYNVLIECVENKTLIPVLSHTEKIANERYQSGYDLHEIQTVINALEQSVWKRVFSKIEPEKYPKYLGLVSTVLGAGKDNLARTYVELASKIKVPTLNLQALFTGSEGDKAIKE